MNWQKLTKDVNPLVHELLARYRQIDSRRIMSLDSDVPSRYKEADSMGRYSKVPFAQLSNEHLRVQNALVEISIKGIRACDATVRSLDRNARDLLQVYALLRELGVIRHYLRVVTRSPKLSTQKQLLPSASVEEDLPVVGDFDLVREEKDKDALVKLLQDKLRETRTEIRRLRKRDEAGRFPSKATIVGASSKCLFKNGRVNFTLLGKELGVSGHTAKVWARKRRIRFD